MQRHAQTSGPSRAMPYRIIAVLLASGAVAVLAYAGVRSRRALEPTRPSGSPGVQFTDARRQAVEFIAYDHSIALTPDQQRLMDTALASIPAPCCDQYSIATCCCPCNLAKAVWGLSKSLIAKQQASAQQVKAAVTDWLQFTNPAGYTGNACFTGGCNRSFARNGCGGMDDRRIR